MRENLAPQLAGEAAVARLLGGEDAAALIERMGAEITGANSGLHALASEAAAASAYFALWSDVTMSFARRDKIPSHWQVFGQRRRLRLLAKQAARHIPVPPKVRIRDGLIANNNGP
jgi:hypothetical protein